MKSNNHKNNDNDVANEDNTNSFYIEKQLHSLKTHMQI